MSSTPGRPGRPRREETERHIREAALRLLRDGGPAAVTVEAVATESGAAKTTIYRRYRDRDEVLLAALGAAVGRAPEPVGATPRAKIRSALGELWRQLSEVLGRGGLAALLGDTDPRFSEVMRSVLTPYYDALVDLVRSDVRRGALREDLDPDAAVSLLLGAYLGELMRYGTVTEDFLERCVDLMWAAMGDVREA